ncbi:unnamed protein product, partial [Staurois parvus]
MTPFCRADSPPYFIRGMASFLKLYFFVIIFRKMKNIFFLHTVT